VVTLITATCDQPIGFGLAEHFVRRQTVWGQVPLQWIVVDDGEVPIRPTLGQEYVRRKREPGCTGVQSFCRNLLTAIPRVRGDLIVIWEHDDWYAPNHLEALLGQLAQDDIQVAGDDAQRYYHVGHRVWRQWKNRGACLCQTGFKGTLLGLFERIILGQLRQGSYGVDGHFWRLVPAGRQSLVHTSTVVGIKGLPGRPGLGLGHRPGNGWTRDPDMVKLREWIGADVEAYLTLSFGRSAA
jgi:hypothetical protein